MRESQYYWIRWNNRSNEVTVAEKRESGKWYITGWDIEIEKEKFTILKRIKPPENN